MAQNDMITTMSVNAGGQMNYINGVWQSGQLTASALVSYAQGNISEDVLQKAVSELLSSHQLTEQEIQFVQSQFEKDVMLYQGLLSDKRFVNALQSANKSSGYVPSDTQSPVSERFIEGLITKNTSGLTPDEIRKLCELVRTKEIMFPNGVRLGFNREKLLTNFIHNANQSVLCADLLKDFVATNRPCEFLLDDGDVQNRKAGGLYVWQSRLNGDRMIYTKANIQLKSNVFDETIYHEMRHHVTTPQINDAMTRENKNPIYHFISEVDTCSYDCFFDKRIRDNQIVASIIDNAQKKASLRYADLTRTEQIRRGNNDARRILMKLYLLSPEERIDYYKELRRNGYIRLPDDFDKITATNKEIPDNLNGIWYALNDMEQLTSSWRSYYSGNYVEAMKNYLEDPANKEAGLAGFVAKYHSSEVMNYIQENLGLSGVLSIQFAQDLGEKYLDLPPDRSKSDLIPLIKSGNTLGMQVYFQTHPQDINRSMYVGKGTLNLTPLHYALNENQFNIAQALIKNPNIDLTIQNDNGESPLGLILSQYGKTGTNQSQLTETAKMMIAENAPISVSSEINLLNQAVLMNDADILRYVVSKGKNTYSIRESNGRNPLLVYVNSCQSADNFNLNEDIVRQLIDLGLSPQTDLPAETFARLRSYPFRDEVLRTAFASTTPPSVSPENQPLETVDINDTKDNPDTGMTLEETSLVDETTTTEETESTDTEDISEPAEPEFNNFVEIKPSVTPRPLTVISGQTPLTRPTNQAVVYSPKQQPRATTSTQEQVIAPHSSTTHRTVKTPQPQQTRPLKPTVSSSMPTQTPDNAGSAHPSSCPTEESGFVCQTDSPTQIAQAEAEKQGFLEKNWQWLLGLGVALAVGVGAYLLIRKQKKKTKKAENTVSELNTEVSNLKDKLSSMQTSRDSSHNSDNSDMMLKQLGKETQH